MTNKESEVNIEDEKKSNEKVEEKPKQKFSEKLNINLSKKTKSKVAKYLTIEPILIGFLFLYLKLKFEESYALLKKCTEFKDDDFLCEEVVKLDVQKTENHKNWTDIARNNSETFVDRVWNDPEFHHVYETHDITVTKLDFQSDFSQTIDLCVTIFGIIMLNAVSYEFIEFIVTLIELLTGGKHLLVFGCLCYLSELERRKMIFVKLGAYALVVTIIRRTPLYINIRDSSTTKGAYTCSVVLYMTYVIFCLAFVKTALSEIKGPSIETNQLLDEDAAVSHLDSVDDTGSIESKKEKSSKMKILAKAFLLDIIYNTVLLVVKDRKDGRRWAILLLLALNMLADFMPFRHYTVSFGDSFVIDNYDFEGVILIIVSILIVLANTNDTIVAVIAVIAPIVAKLVTVSFGLFDFELFNAHKTKTGIYDNFFNLQTFAVLFIIVEKNEISIYSAFIAASLIANGFQNLMPDVLHKFIQFVMVAYVLLLVMGIGLCFLVYLMKKVAEANAENNKKKLSISLKVVAAVNKMKILRKRTKSSEVDIVNGNEEISAHHANECNVGNSPSSETIIIGNVTEEHCSSPSNRGNVPI